MEPVEVDSRIESVVVFARGARVRRIATVSAPTSVVRLTGLPLAVIDDTIVTEVDGPAVVQAVRVAEDVMAAVEAEETAELRAARRRVALAESEAERIGQAIDRTSAAPLVVEDPSEDGPAPWAAVVAARRQLIAIRAEREVALRERLGAARHELDEAQRSYEVVAERDARTGSARGAKLHEPRTYIELALALTGTGPVTLHVEYQVTAARWAPSYVARLDGETVTFEVRAVVAQDSGEAWDGVAIKLSTAEPTRFAELPELSAQKIGRRQGEHPKKGFRAPPTGADELYRDYDRVFPRRRVSTSFAKGGDSTYEGRAPTAEEFAGVAKDQVWDEESSNAMPSGPPPSMSTPRPVMLQPGGIVRAKSAGIASALGGIRAAPARMVVGAAQSIAQRGSSGGGGEMAKTRAVTAEPGAPVPRLDYAGLVMRAASDHDRGLLVGTVRASSDYAAAAVRIDRLALPPGHANAWDHVYDYAFVADGAVDVKSDATWHSIALTTRAGTAKLRHVAVPREQADVFRVAAIANPLEGPLLPGPIDVYDRGQFLVTSEVDYTPPGGTVEVGLGVDAQVKVARNVEYHEEATGMLRGGLRLVHEISIDVENLGQRPVDVEIRERVPVARDDDDDVEITLGKIDPAWERWTPDPSAPKDERLRGGYRWRVALAASAKQSVRVAYEIKIAGKHELVGGNRRES
ncbi:MAG: DUF4139 domain-containing protein [Kofleriaceae bacterium]